MDHGLNFISYLSLKIGEVYAYWLLPHPTLIKKNTHIKQLVILYGGAEQNLGKP